MKNIIQFLIVLLLFTKLSGQSSNSFIPKINNIPSSPEAALLGRFGDIPIGYYTGTANISIPLYTINVSGVEVPIVISYHNSGIKVADEATWVGLGWNLEPGGQIIQEVRGKPDYEDNLYWTNRLNSTPGQYAVFSGHFGPIGTPTAQNGDCLKYAPNSGEGMFQCTSSSDAEVILYSLLANNGQPDIYSYNIPGYSGKYYNNRDTGELVQMDRKEKLYIQGNTIVTPEGNSFYFNTSESITGSVFTDITGITNKLTSISTTDGKSVRFTYTDEKYTNNLYRASVTINPYEPGASGSPNSWNDVAYGNKKRLDSIITADTYIVFNAESREDLLVDSHNNLKRLKSIDIISRSNNAKIKSFVFSYSYFNPNYNYNSKRLRLDSIKEVGYDSNGQPDNSKPPYVFEYDTSVNLPAKNSTSVDFWGYYNGQNNSTLIPNLNYFDFEHDSRYMTGGQPSFRYTYTNQANRYPDSSMAKAFMLKKIIYPTSGYTEFEFEANSYTNQFIPTVSQEFSTNRELIMTKRQSGTYFTPPGTYFVSIGNSTTLRFNISFTHGSPRSTYDGALREDIISTMYTGSLIIFTKSVPGQATQTLKTWSPASIYGSYGNFRDGIMVNPGIEELPITYTPGATYTFNVTYPHIDNFTYSNDYISQAYASVRYFDRTVINTTVSTNCGFRVKTIKNYAASGVLVSHKQINYTDGKLLNRFEPLESIAVSYNNYVSPNTYSISANRVSMSSDDFGMNGGNPIGYGKVEEVELANAGTENIGKKIFIYNNEMNQTWKGMPADPLQSNGLLKSEIILNRQLDTISKNTYYYTYSNYNLSFGIKIRNHSFGNTDAGAFNPSYKYSYALYPITSQLIQLTNKTTTDIFNGSPVFTTESYTYNTNGQQNIITTTFDANDINNYQKTSKIYYPGEIAGGPASETQMVAAKMTGVPVRKEEYRGTELLSTQKTEYVNSTATGGHMLPLYIYNKKGSDASVPIELRVTFNRYDSWGNILQYTLANGSPVSIIWGYNNTQPIAKIENATYASISSTLITAAQTASNGLSESNLITALNNLRSGLPNAMVTTYTFKPLLGVSTITDPRGYRISYTYDNLGRLIFAKDMDGNILSENQYHFKP